jgi:MFS transporter, YNFM family, putative membrane transport protein
VPWGWTNAFLGFAALQVLLAAIVVWLFPKAEPSRVPTTEPLLAWLRGVWPVLRNDIPHVAVGGFVLMVTQAAVTSYIAIRLAGEPFYWSTQALGALYAVFLPALIAVHLVPLAIQTRGSVRTLAVAIGAAWAGLGLTLFDHEALILVGMVVVSACVFVVQTVLAHHVGAVAVERRDKASSGYIACYYLGASVGAQAPSLFWNSFGWPGCVAFVVLAQMGGLVLARKADRWSAGSGA